MLCFAIFKLFGSVVELLIDFLSLDCGVQVNREIQDRFLCIDGQIDRLAENYYFAHRSRYLSPWGRPLASNSAKALQRAAELLLFKLPAAAAAQSSGPDPNKFVDYSPAPALPAQQTSRSDSAANVQRPRACAQANCSELQRSRAGA